MLMVYKLQFESVGDSIKRAMKQLQESSWDACTLKADNVEVFIYKESCFEDICEKYDLLRKIFVDSF